MIRIDPDTILVVNDNADQLDLVQYMLEAEGYNVLRALDGAEGLEIATRDFPDLVVSDVRMPVMNGIEMCRRIRRVPHLATIPILLMSALQANNERVVEGFSAGADDYLEIPFESELFTARVKRLLERRHDEEARIKLVKTQDALRKSEERYQNLFQNTPFPLWVYDLKTFRFLAVNEAAIIHYGYSADEFLSMTVLDILPTRDDDAERPARANPPADRRTILKHRKKNGELIDAEITAHEIVFDERSARLVLANDITERLRAEEALRLSEERLHQSQKLESIGRLAGGIAHDFNNMLTAINGYSDMTLRRLDRESPLRRNIEQIKKAGERSALLTQQLLAFSRKQIMRPEVLDINSIIADTSLMLKHLIGEDISFSLALGDELGHIKVDPGQLSQVIINLVVNARDAMPRGGKLTIETSNAYLDRHYASQHPGFLPGPYVMLAVNDTGIGMTEETQKHIFEPFFTTKKSGQGTGLGLSTVYGIIKQSGANIWVYSEVEKGTTCKIYFPMVEKRLRPKERTFDVEAFYTGHETIMLVEDEESVRELGCQILESCGYKVIKASNGVEALEVCAGRTVQIDLLMTDVVMPLMGGRELAERLAETHPDLRVLFTSGYTDDTIIRHGVIDPGTNFLQKPFTFDSLARKVRTLLDASAGHPEARPESIKINAVSGTENQK